MRNRTALFAFFIIFLLALASSAGAEDVTLFHPRVAEVHSEDFESDLSAWVVEQVEGGTAGISGGRLEIDDAGGCTVWFKEKLSAPVSIEYDVMLVRAGGPRDEVSDLNCFWMAIDPEHPGDIFARSEERGGRFPNYHGLRLYYVGYGANRNTTTRFRRYTGTGERPLLPEHDLRDARFMHRGNEWLHIQLIVAGNRVQYLREGEIVFDFEDPEPYTEGWFGFRTVRNHMKIDNFRVYRLAEKPLEGTSLANHLISRAGNADRDDQRLAILQRIAALPDLKESLRADLGKVIEFVTTWVESPYLPFFGRAIGSSGGFYDFGIPEDSPVYPLTHIYQGHMITWFSNESGGVWGYPDRKREWMDRARGFYEKAHEAFPENRIVRMYLAEAIPPKIEYPAVPNAPEWAVSQREALERVSEVIEWWIENRQQEDGSYGGGWGDDVEMWRHWIPVMIGFENPGMTAAQARLSNAVMTQPHMAGGYMSHVSDVQHTSEDSADSITPMMHLEPLNDIWTERALKLADLMENLWTGRNERGMLQFKSTYFSSERVDLTPVRAIDHFQNVRAVQPALLYWQRTGDERLTRLFTDWLDTWVDAAEREERGKPAGILPNCIHWPDGQAGGLEEPWWNPKNYAPHSIYWWPNPLRFMGNTLVQAYHMTGDKKYVEALRGMADARLEYLKTPPADLEEGSWLWCGSRLGGLTTCLAKYALISGSDDFDELIEMETPASYRFLVKGDIGPLQGYFAQLAEALRWNYPGYTSEVRYTDRVFTFPRILGGNAMFPEAQAHSHQPRMDTLYSSVTGDPGTPDYFPLNAVRWLTPSRDIAALVTKTGTDRFAAELFHFGDEPRKMAAEFYLLEEGDYRLTVFGKGKETPLAEKVFTVNGRRTRVEFELPVRRLVAVEVRNR